MKSSFAWLIVVTGMGLAALALAGFTLFVVATDIPKAGNPGAAPQPMPALFQPTQTPAESI